MNWVGKLIRVGLRLIQMNEEDTIFISWLQAEVVLDRY